MPKTAPSALLLGVMACTAPAIALPTGSKYVGRAVWSPAEFAYSRLFDSAGVLRPLTTNFSSLQASYGHCRRLMTTYKRLKQTYTRLFVAAAV